MNSKNMHGEKIKNIYNSLECSAFWVRVPCSLVCGYYLMGENFSFHRQVLYYGSMRLRSIITQIITAQSPACNPYVAHNHKHDDDDYDNNNNDNNNDNINNNNINMQHTVRTIGT